MENLTAAIATGADPGLLAAKLNETGSCRQRLKDEIRSAGMSADWMDKQVIVDYLTKQKQIVFDRNDSDQCLNAIRASVKEVIVYPGRPAEVILHGPD